MHLVLFFIVSVAFCWWVNYLSGTSGKYSLRNPVRRFIDRFRSEDTWEEILVFAIAMTVVRVAVDLIIFIGSLLF